MASLAGQDNGSHRFRSAQAHEVASLEQLPAGELSVTGEMVCTRYHEFGCTRFREIPFGRKDMWRGRTPWRFHAFAPRIAAHVAC